MYIYTYIYIYIYINTFSYIYLYEYIYTYINRNMYLHIYIVTYVYIHIYIYQHVKRACTLLYIIPTEHICAYRYICVYTHDVHIYSFIYVYIYIYIHTNQHVKRACTLRYVITISQRTHVATRECRAKGKFSKPILPLDLLCQMTIALTFENFLHRWACRTKDAQKKYRRVYMHTNEYIYT
jgi:hypothetical protein